MSEQDPPVDETNQTQDAPTGEEPQVETEVDAPVTRKELQKEQFKRANFEKKIDSRFDELKDLLAKTQTAKTETAIKNKFADLKQQMAESIDEEALTPKTRKVLAGLIEAGEERGENITPAELRELKETAAYERFWGQKEMAPFREDFESEQKKQEDAGRSGTRLEGYMEAWLENHLAEKATTQTAKPRAQTPPGRDKVISAGTGAKPATQDFDDLLDSGKHGNAAGIKMSDIR